MLEFKVCIPDDKTEQILQLFKKLDLYHEPIIPEKPSNDIVKSIKKRASSNEFELLKKDNPYKIFIHRSCKKEIEELKTKEAQSTFKEILKTLQCFPLSYPIIYTKYKAAVTDHFKIYYRVREDLKICQLLLLEKEQGKEAKAHSHFENLG